MDLDYNRRDKRDEEEDSVFNLKVVDLLKARVKLDNGEDGYVFTKNTDENPRGRFRCHVCNVPIGSSKSLQEHASGKNHTRRMQANFHAHENFSKIVIKETSKLSTDVGGKVIKAPGVDIPDLAPGEPVPPGFEDIVTRVPEITSTLEEMKAPLIGLEYLAEITPVGDELEPKYCCLLCNKRGDPRTVLAHLVCFNHRIKYIGRYFPRTNTALALIPKIKEYKRGTGEVLAKIVKAIESKFGRLNPVIVDGAIFDEKKEEYYREMRDGRHFYETADSNYELLVDLDFIKSCAPEADAVLTIDLEKEEAKKRSTAMKNEMNKSKSKNFSMDSEKRNYEKKATLRPNNLKRETKREKSVETISTSGSRSYSRSRSRSYTPSRSRSRSHSRSRSRPHYRYMYRDYSHSDRRSRSPRYYCRSRSISRSLSRSRSGSRGSSYRRYRTSSYRTKSPVYVRSSFRTIRYDSLYKDDEYSSERPKSTQVKVAELRNRRKKRDLYADYVEKLEKDMLKTLKGYKKNPEKHPLYPEEWKKFWNRRYKELTAEGIDASKHDFKPEWIKFWLVRMKELHNEELQMKKNKYKADLGLLENDKSSGIDSDVIEVSPTPLEDDKNNITVEDIKNTWKALTGSEIKSTEEKSKNNSDFYELGSMSNETDNQVRVITVLRLLTALESQLGSLGPRVNNLLAQAIALENKKPNSSDSLIDISENHVLFETVKEKLKGQLFAGIVEKHMVNATRAAIQNVAELFNSWKARKINPEPVYSANSSVSLANSEPLIVPGIGAVDKVAIAQQIAAALIAQGKTNVSEQELEQVINAVVGMAQASTWQNTVFTAASTSVSATSQQVSSSFGASPSDVNNTSDADSSTLHKLVSSASKTSSFKTFQSVDEPEMVKNKMLGMFQKEIKDLSEEDMKTFLQNFKDLPSDEQQSLIAYLKELESKDPNSVEKLRKFVGSISEFASKNESKTKEDSMTSGRLSPFSMREGGANPFIDDRTKIQSRNLDNNEDDDDDDDDYSYEDIYKAAEKKVSGKFVVEKMIEEQQKKVKLSQSQTSPFSEKSFPQDVGANGSKSVDDPECVLSEAKVMIDNIMGQLPSKYNCGTARNVNVKNVGNPRSTISSESPATVTYSSQPLYDAGTTVPSTNKISNNLLNDYNYQDDIFGYSNDGFQNYSAGSESYQLDSNSNDSFNQPMVPAYSSYATAEQTYNNYESWNDNYAQYAPPQHSGYSCPSTIPPPMIDPNFNRPPIPYQSSPRNDYGGPPLYNNTYRDYY